MTISDLTRKFSYREGISPQNQLKMAKDNTSDFSKRAQKALARIQAGVLSNKPQDSERSQTPPHLIIEYVDLELIPEGQYLKNKISKIVEWHRNHHNQVWRELNGDTKFRTLLFSLDTNCNNLINARDNFRKNMAPLKEKPFLMHTTQHVSASGTVNEVAQGVLKGALEGVMAVCAGAARAGTGLEPTYQDFSGYNRDAYEQQVRETLCSKEDLCEFLGEDSALFLRESRQERAHADARGSSASRGSSETRFPPSRISSAGSLRSAISDSHAAPLDVREGTASSQSVIQRSDSESPVGSIRSESPVEGVEGRRDNVSETSDSRDVSRSGFWASNQTMSQRNFLRQEASTEDF